MSKIFGSTLITREGATVVRFGFPGSPEILHTALGLNRNPSRAEIGALSETIALGRDSSDK